MPTVATLAITTEEQQHLRLDSPALFAGLTSCTDLQLMREGWEGEDHITIAVSPAVFAALPNLRTLTWEGPTFTLAPPAPGGSPFHPLLGGLESLTLRFSSAPGKEVFSQLVPHMPNFQQLELVWKSGHHTFPAAVFDLTSLQRLDLVDESRGRLGFSNDIGRLTRLTELRVWRGKVNSTVLPAIGNLSRLQSLVLSACGLRRIPESWLQLTRLTELSLTLLTIKSYPNLSSLRQLKV